MEVEARPLTFTSIQVPVLPEEMPASWQVFRRAARDQSVVADRSLRVRESVWLAVTTDDATDTVIAVLVKGALSTATESRFAGLLPPS